MKNLKGIFSAIISLTMVISLFGAFSVQADSTEYNFYTQVGESFTPVTEDVTWENSDTIDTSLMGRQVIYGTDSSGATVKGIINVGVLKWNSYQNNEEKTADSNLLYGNTRYDQWRYVESSDGAALATYVQDPKNSNNIVVKYNGGADIESSIAQNKKVNYNQIQYYPATQTVLGNAYSVEFRFMADGNAINGDTYDIQFRSGKYSCYDSLTLKRTGSGLVVSLVPKGGKTSNGTAVTWDKNPKTDEWLDIKYMVYEQEGTIYCCVYLNGEKILNVASMNKTTVDGAEKIVPIEYLYIKGSAGIALDNINNAVRFAGYLDDVKITDLTTADYIYYDLFDSEYKYEYMQSDGTQAMNINETIKFVTDKGEDSNYSTEIYASAVADTSKIGVFNSKTALPGFDEPINISWTVYKEQLAWEETFENYTEADIDEAPSRAPWISGKNGKTVAYEDAAAENKNTVLNYNFTGQDSEWLRMGDGKSIDGKFSIGWSFKLPELVANTDCKFQIMAGTLALVEANISVNGEKNARIGISSREGNVYPLVYGELKANTWYTVNFNVDTVTDKFTYSIGDINDTTERTIKIENTGAFDMFRFAQRGATSGDLKIYVDNINVNKILTIQEPVSQNITVYKGDDAVLPETATVLLTDGETTDVADVEWNGTVDTDNVGTKTIIGDVTGTNIPATLNVEVSAYPYEIVNANLKNGNKEVFGLIKGGMLCSATLNKISNNTIAGRIYAAVYDAEETLIGASAVSIDTSAAWNKDAYKDIAITLNIPNSEDIDIDTCTLKLFVLSDSLVPLAEVNAQSNSDEQTETTVWIAGDSLAETKKATATSAGWGEAFAALCKTAGITVENHALGGRSSKSFYDQELLKDILTEAKAGDYLFVQFGHNDCKSDDPTRYTTYTEGGTFEEYMTKYITEARVKGVIPVILTPVVRATWPKLNGVTNGGTQFIGATNSNLADYAAAAKRVAEKYHVPMIDIHALTNDYFTAFSDDSEWTDEEKTEVWKYFDYYSDITTLEVGNADTTHLNKAGAELVANMIKAEMENIRLPLYKLFNN